MKPMSRVALAATLAASVLCTGRALAQLVTEVPATYRGKAACESRYPGSFLDIGTSACWQCSTAYPNRTIFPVTGAQACERPATELFKKALGPERPTGLIGTDCRSGWFLDIGKRACYSCAGYQRTAYPVDNARACSRAVPVAWTSATRKGTPGCPDGSFRNGLTDSCYSCPAQYMRNALIADDLTKVNACTQISASVVDATRAKFEQYKDAFNPTRDNLGRTSMQVTTYETGQRVFDQMSRDLMQLALVDELRRASGFNTISWMVSGEIGVTAGYIHRFGYVMTKTGDSYECKKTWANAFTAGLAASAGIIIEAALAKGAAEAGASEANGWQIAASYPPVSAGFGLHWEAANGELSPALSFGPGFDVDVNFSQYVHTWAEVGKAVSCDGMSWGPSWFTS